MSSIGVFGQTEPTYSWIDNSPQGNVGATNPDKIIISVATDSRGFVYLLTFGDGIKKYDSDGNLLEIYISKNKFNDPIDLEFNSKDELFVADLNDRVIKVFDSNGNYLPERDLSSNFYKPYGVAIDNNDNVYVADYNDGSGAEGDVSSRIRIFYMDGSIKQFEGPSNNKITQPYRLDVNSQGKIFISHTANGGEVIIFDKDFQYVDKLENLGSPGSVVVDDMDFIHVIDYADRLNLVKIINFDIGNSELKDIRDGIRNEEFKIKIFDSDFNFIKSLDEKIELPLDLAFTYCESKLFVNNTDLDYNSFLFFLSKLKFDLEIYQRTPSFDIEKPVLVFCPEDRTETLTNGEFELEDYRDLANFSDNCDSELELVQVPAPNSTISQTTTITITAEDDAGNVSEACSFQIIIDNVPDTTAPEITCPVEIIKNNDPGKCGAVVNFDPPMSSDNSGAAPTITRADNSDLNSGDLFPVGITTITFEAKDATGNTSECSFTITIEDNEGPEISFCPEDITETVAFGETGKIINFNRPTFNDNCAVTNIALTAGLASGSEFPVGETTITFTATDASENTATCSFVVTIKEGEDTQDPEIDCTDNITKNNDPGKCDAVVNFDPPTASDNSGDAPTITRTDNSDLNSGDLFPVGITTITFEAKDATGNTSECSFTITIEDIEKPTISLCPENITEAVGFGETGKTISFDAPTFSDNCSGVTVEQTEGPASGSEFPVGETTITFTATDASENSASCSFTVTVEKNEEPTLPFTCKSSITFQLDSNGQVNIAPDDLYNGDGSDYSFSINQSNFNCEDTGEIQLVTLTYTGAINGSCDIEVDILDFIKPEITCPANIVKTINQGEETTVVNFDIPEAEDNCSVTIEQTAGMVSGSQFPLGISTIEFTATDLNENSTVCSFDIIIKNEENQSPVARDDTYTVDQNTTLNVALPGVLENDQDADGDNLEAILSSDASNGNLSFNSDGSFTYIPDIDFSGQDSFVYYVTDGEGESNEAIVTIEVVSEDEELDFECIEEISLALDESGIAILNIDDLYVGEANGFTFSVSQTDFTCEHLGSNTVRLSFSANGEEGFCDIEVNIIDDLPPNLELRDIEISLNAEGTASISAEDINAGSSDNCTETLEFTLGKTNFSCKDLGENIVNVSVQDESGNSSNSSIIVTVKSDNGICDFNPVQGGDYVFIYPNPNAGNFAINAPRGIIIEKINVFDNRGRFITKKLFPENTSTYKMDIGSHREAIYILQIYTNEGELMRKLIFRN